MKRLSLALALWASLSCAALAQVGGLSFPGPGPGHSAGGTCGGFTPASFGANLIAWYKSPDTNTNQTGNGTNVSSWTDSSGHGFTIAPNFAGTPTYQSAGLGGKPAVIFNAANTDRLNNASVAFGAVSTVSAFMLSSFTGSSLAAGGLGLFDGGGNKMGLVADGAAPGVEAVFGFGNGVVQTAAINTELRLGIVFNGSTAITYVNNVANSTPFSASPTAIGTQSAGFNIAGNSSAYDGAVREMFFVNVAVTTVSSPSLSDVDCYLQSRQ